MDVFRTDRIRNVVLLGHGGAGKTTLAEAMAYLAGMTSRLGRVEDGNTVSDYDKEEIKRHFSITTSLIPVPWDKMKVNVLDTPGYFDLWEKLKRQSAPQMQRLSLFPVRPVFRLEHRRHGISARNINFRE